MPVVPTAAPMTGAEPAYFTSGGSTAAAASSFSLSGIPWWGWGCWPGGDLGLEFEMSRSSSDGGMVTLLLLGGPGGGLLRLRARVAVLAVRRYRHNNSPVIAPSPAPTVAALVVPAGENTSYYGGNVPTNPATPVIALPVIPATFPVGSVGAKMVAQLVAQGQTQAQATATVQAALASTGAQPSIHWRASGAW